MVQFRDVIKIGRFNSLLAENNEIKAIEYLRYELPTRLANMLKEMNRLPKELLGLFKIAQEFSGEIFAFELADISTRRYYATVSLVQI